MNEEHFITELINGDQLAYAKLVDMFQQKVFATCISFIPNKEDAEDVAQEVFLEIYKSIHKFKGNSKLSTWIYKITTNKCLEFIRKKNTKKRFSFFQFAIGDEIDVDKTKYFTEINHPGVLLENKETTEAIFKAINALPESQRVVFTLAKLDGKSYQEIVEITGKTLSSVESIMFRARKKLEEKLTKYKKSNN